MDEVRSEGRGGSDGSYVWHDLDQIFYYSFMFLKIIGSHQYKADLDLNAAFVEEKNGCQQVRTGLVILIVITFEDTALLDGTRG